MVHPISGFRAPESLKDTVAFDRYLRRFQELKTERDPHLDDWKDITDYIKPTRGRYLMESVKEKSKRATKIINNTATRASRTCTAGMKAGIASSARPWFRLTLADRELAKFPIVKMWLWEVQSLIYKIMAASNFYNSLTQLFSDVSDFGNSVMVLDEDFDDVIRCTVFSPGEYYFATSSKNVVNTVYREFTMSVVQIIEQFGAAASTATKQAYDSGNYGYQVPVIHAIEPNLEYNEGAKGWRGMPFTAVYFEKGGDAGQFLERKGYNEWPAPAPRWDVMAGDIYGSGPGLVALGDAKALQTMERRKAQGIDKMITPPMQGPMHLRSGGVNHMPGGVTFVDPNMSGAGKPLTTAYEISSNGIAQMREEIREHERRIDASYFVDLFLMISQSIDRGRQPITAREVEERHEEKLFALGPMLERMHDENLSMVIQRAFAIAQRGGIVPPPPKELIGKEVKIEYVSLLAYAQKASSINSIERSVGFVGQMATVEPGLQYKINMEKTIDEYLDAVGAPQTIISTDREYMEKRGALQKQMEQAQASAQGAQMVDSAQKLSKTPTDGKNALTDILRMTGAQ